MFNEPSQKKKVFSTGFLILVLSFILIGYGINVVTLSESTGSKNFTTEYIRESIVFNHELAKRWAPIHHQDVDATGSHGLGGRSDYITAINFDGDWIATNNWDNIANINYSPTAHCYYSVVTTSTHWFITYAFFHPRDWTDIFFLYGIDEHENDLEGVLMIVEKDGSTYGDLKGAVTVFHSDFYSYIPSSSNYQENYETIDGTLQMLSYNNELHPVTAQECRGHGLKAYPDINIDGDGIIYYPSMVDVAEAPEDNYDNFVQYKLVDIFETNGLWEQRFNTQLFSGSNSGFLSSYGNGNANPPWRWDDGDDDIPNGHIATFPAGMTGEYFKNLGVYSYLYTENEYSGRVLNEGAYRICTKHSSKLLDVSGGSTSNGANIIQWEENSGDNQIWRIYSNSNGYYRIESKKSGKVIDVAYMSLEDGTNIFQWEYNGGDNQFWSFNEPEPGYYNIISKLSGKAISIEDYSIENGANVEQWSLTGGDNQRFQLFWESPVDF